MQILNMAISYVFSSWSFILSAYMQYTRIKPYIIYSKSELLYCSYHHKMLTVLLPSFNLLDATTRHKDVINIVIMIFCKAAL